MERSAQSLPRSRQAHDICLNQRAFSMHAACRTLQTRATLRRVFPGSERLLAPKWLHGWHGMAVLDHLELLPRWSSSVAPIRNELRQKTWGMKKTTLSPPKVHVCSTTVLPTRIRSVGQPTILHEHVLTCGPTHTCACGVKGSGARRSGESTCSGEHRRRGMQYTIQQPRFSTVPTTPATQHSKHDRCMVTFQSSCTCARHANAWDNF